MNWTVFGLACAIALVAKFASTRAMSPGQRQAWVVVAVGQGVVLGWLTPQALSINVLLIVALLGAGDILGYQLGIGIDKLRIWRYGKAAQNNGIYNGAADSGRGHSDSESEGTDS